MIFVAGNTINCALKKSKQIIKSNRIPIINYIKENTNNEKDTYNEYIKILNSVDKSYKVALKLSSFNFNEMLVNDIVDKYKSKNIKLLIDAEDSSNNDRYHEISNRLILAHNDNLNLIKTYQMYRKDSFQQLQEDINLFENYKKKIGIKLVRGAYWNNERFNNQLFTLKNDTDNNYNKTINFLDEKDCFTILATHNQKSINLGLSKTSDFKFAHLLDMSTTIYDKVSKTNDVYVYIPYGPYYSMIPYLIRRLYENMDMVKYMTK